MSSPQAFLQAGRSRMAQALARWSMIHSVLRWAVRDGAGNATWIGDIMTQARLSRVPLLGWLLDGLDHVDTESIIQRFAVARAARDQKTAPTGCVGVASAVAAFQGKLDLSGGKPADSAAASSFDPSFCIVIPFARHMRFLPACLGSVASLSVPPGTRNPQVIVVNDDPQVQDHEVSGFVPQPIRDRVQLLRPRVGGSISRALNEAVSRATEEWILFLDCDDLLERDALMHLTDYIRKYPRIRYISSCIIDIDEQDRVLRYRRRNTFGPSTMLYAGMQAGHLKCIRRDAFQVYGVLNENCDGAQDYEFALRMCFLEPLLFVPDYLYRYRYHAGTFSLSRSGQQDEVAGRITRTYKCAAMIDGGLLDRSSGLTISFRGSHAAQWAVSMDQSLVEPEGTVLRINTGEVEPTAWNRRLLILEIAYCVMQFGATPWKSPFDIQGASALQRLGAP